MKERTLKNKIRKLLENLGIEDVMTLNEVVRMCTKYVRQENREKRRYIKYLEEKLKLLKEGNEKE